MLIKEIKGDFNNCVGFPGQVSLNGMKCTTIRTRLIIVCPPTGLLQLAGRADRGGHSVRDGLIYLGDDLYRSAYRHYTTTFDPQDLSGAARILLQLPAKDPIAEACPSASDSKREGYGEQEIGQKVALGLVLLPSHLFARGRSSSNSTLLFLFPHARLLDQYHVQDSPRVVGPL